VVIYNRTAVRTSRIEVPRYSTRLDPQRDELGLLGDSVRNRQILMDSISDRLKRAFDITFASIALFLLSPIILITAILIKLESRGPVFFKQERIGINRRTNDRRNNPAFSYGGAERRNKFDRRKEINLGKPFNIYKLRTMVDDAENSGPTFASKGDPRITRIGNIMRRSRLDEVPQFLNVIKGDMSIVGPRPERSFFINKIRQDVPEFPLRLKVKPGITGLAQVENGYAKSLDMMSEKLYFDLKYISEVSILQELKILFKTVYVVISGKGAC
jgi:lipopolysaccharide/colanic/teichoic acid biosynthesis glycosyltransferase